MWMGFVKKKIHDNENFGVDPPAFEKRSHFDLFVESFPYGMNKDAFGFLSNMGGVLSLLG